LEKRNNPALAAPQYPHLWSNPRAVANKRLMGNRVITCPALTRQAKQWLEQIRVLSPL
jgi:hypothetical protein